MLWEALSERTRLVWFETPTNPLLKTVDIASVAATVARRATEGGRRPLIVVDNTFASPAIQRPLTLGADIVFHSATKYLAGHSDTILGLAVTSDEAIAERLRFLQNAMGAVPGPQDCFLVLRGLRTLHLRVERHGTNAAAVAAFLRERPDVAEVHYPGIGGMVSFLAAPGGSRTAAERAIAIAEGTRLFTLAESLGGVESLIEVPASMTHMSVTGSALEIDPALVRLSVGIEGVEDLIADLSGGARRLLRDFGDPAMSTDAALVARELRDREPIFHRPEHGTKRSDFEAMTVIDYWEVGPPARSTTARPVWMNSIGGMPTGPTIRWPVLRCVISRFGRRAMTCGSPPTDSDKASGTHAASPFGGERGPTGSSSITRAR